MTLVTLVFGATAAAREEVIARALDPAHATAVILEGLPDGSSRLDSFSDLPHFHLARIAPGCLCCTGNLTMRVTLNRMLRRKPERLYIALATDSHIDQIRSFLSHAPYDNLLQLAKDLHA